MSSSSIVSDDATAPAADWLELVRRSTADLRFGSVQITVHEGRVTQVEVVQRTRFWGEGAKISGTGAGRARR
jgi:hypothetical protein